MEKNNKPNFTIQISDNFCVYEYPLYLSGDYSIEDIVKKLYTALNLHTEKGKLIEYYDGKKSTPNTI